MTMTVKGWLWYFSATIISSSLQSFAYTIASYSSPPTKTPFIGTTRMKMASTNVLDGVRISWETEIAEIISQRREHDISQQDNKNHSPFLVGLVGIPGSGKTTSSLILSHLIDEKRRTSQSQNGESSTGTLIVPMDGYHYPLETLRSFPNAQDMIYRRGAPDTFDSKSLYHDLSQIKNGGTKKGVEKGDDDEINIPGFDHAKGDPEPNKYTFRRNQHDIIICEGLYLLHNSDGWDDIRTMFDFTIFISSDVDVCIDRLKERNKCIPGYTAEEIEIRCDEVDRVNAMTVLSSRDRADMIVDSHSVLST